MVDNASQDGTVGFIESNYPEVHLIRLCKNIGFGRANNIGIKYAIDSGAEYLLLLNQDAWLEKDCLNNMLAVVPFSEKYILWSPLHFNGSKSSLDIHFSEFLLTSVPPGELLSDTLMNKIKPIYTIPYVNAAIWLLSSGCIHKIGFFNPLFRHYGEDMEYCSRIRHLGYCIGIIPTASAVHNRIQNYFSDRVYNKNRFILKTKANILFLLINYQSPIWLNMWRAFKKICSTNYGASLSLNSFIIKIELMIFAFYMLPMIIIYKYLSNEKIKFFRSIQNDINRFVPNNEA